MIFSPTYHSIVHITGSFSVSTVFQNGCPSKREDPYVTFVGRVDYQIATSNIY